MKIILTPALILLISVSIHAQNSWKDLSQLPSQYQLDGNISAREVWDTVAMKYQQRSSHYIIKRSESFTYIGIQSNGSTILNAYLVDDERIKVLHASAALGQVDLIKDGNEYKPTQMKFDWIYRDPIAWGDDKHPEGVDTPEDFYKRFGWTANTWHSGSYREFEMVIDNTLITDNTRLIISYSSSIDGIGEIRFKEGSEDVSLSGNKETDDKLHNGYLPESLTLQ